MRIRAFFSFPHIAALILSALSIACPWRGKIHAQDNTNLLVVAEGKQQLYQKVLVKKERAIMLKSPRDTDGPPVAPFAVFHHLKTETGALEKDGCVRVGTGEGEHIGWIKKENVCFWNSRFVLSPSLSAEKDRAFILYNEETLKTEKARCKEIPSEYTVTAPILKTEGRGVNTVFNIAFINAKVKTAGVVKKRDDKFDVKLDIVFLLDTTGSMQPAINGTREVLARVATELDKMPEVKGQIRFGLVEYRDSDKESGFVTRTTSHLTGDLGAFAKVLETVRAGGGGDLPEQVFAGLQTAILETKWDPKAIKHIIIVGDASAKEKDQDDTKQSDGGWQTGIRNFVTLKRPTSGSAGDKLFGSIYFHAVRAVLNSPYPEVQKDNELCKAQFQEIAKNNGEYQGYYADLDSDVAESKKKVVGELVDKLSRAAAALDKLRHGQLQGSDVAAREIGEVERPLFEYANMLKGKAPDLVDFAWAEEYDKGREVAFKRVLVSKDEMEHLRNSLEYLHGEFKKFVSVKKRANIKNLLKALQQNTVVVASGQTLTEKTQLADLIRDLPLRTNVLKIELGALASMDDKTYNAWLDRLAEARDCAKKIMDPAGPRTVNWEDITRGFAEKELYTYLRISEMP